MLQSSAFPKRSNYSFKPVVCLLYYALSWIYKLGGDNMRSRVSVIASGLIPDNTRPHHLICQILPRLFSPFLLSCTKDPLITSCNLIQLEIPGLLIALLHCGHYWLSGYQLPSNLQWLFELFVSGCWDTFINTTAYMCYLRDFISSKLPRALI